MAIVCVRGRAIVVRKHKVSYVASLWLHWLRRASHQLEIRAHLLRVLPVPHHAELRTARCARRKLHPIGIVRPHHDNRAVSIVVHVGRDVHRQRDVPHAALLEEKKLLSLLRLDAVAELLEAEHRRAIPVVEDPPIAAATILVCRGIRDETKHTQNKKAMGCRGSLYQYIKNIVVILVLF